VTQAYSFRGPVPRTASAAKRFAAFFFDATIVFVFTWTLTFSLAYLGVLQIPDASLAQRTLPVFGLMWIVSVFELPLLLVYATLLEWRGGRTLGKMAFGLRVAHDDGRAPDLFHSFVRNLLRLLWVTPFGPAFVLADAWALQRTELDQRMGDIVAGTVVLDERAP